MMDVILGLGILINWIAFLIPRKKSSRCYERPNGKNTVPHQLVGAWRWCVCDDDDGFLRLEEGIK